MSKGRGKKTFLLQWKPCGQHPKEYNKYLTKAGKKQAMITGDLLRGFPNGIVWPSKESNDVFYWIKFP